MKIVVKVGTGVLTRENGTLDGSSIVHLVSALADLMQQGHQVVLVSSGAVGSGVSVLGLPSYPQELSLKQACAAVGQTRLMQTYENLFNHFDVDVAQLLLTAEDLKRRRHNVQATVLRLFEYGGIIPIVNENDTVSVEELKFGDNDILSVHMARLVEADALFILTSVDGLYPPGGSREAIIPRVEDVDAVLAFAGGPGPLFHGRHERQAPGHPGGRECGDGRLHAARPPSGTHRAAAGGEGGRSRNVFCTEGMKL